jgi:hypothetical protein
MSHLRRHRGREARPTRGFVSLHWFTDDELPRRLDGRSATLVLAAWMRPLLREVAVTTRGSLEGHAPPPTEIGIRPEHIAQSGGRTHATDRRSAAGRTARAESRRRRGRDFHAGGRNGRALSRSLRIHLSRRDGNHLVRPNSFHRSMRQCDVTSKRRRKPQPAKMPHRRRKPKGWKRRVPYSYSSPPL